MHHLDYLNIRAALRMTQAEFARVLNIHQMTISRWERGVLIPGAREAAILEGLKQLPPEHLPDLGRRMQSALVLRGELAAYGELIAAVL